MEAAMQAIFFCCAGLDVHLKTVWACIRRLDPQSGKIVVKEIRVFNTTTEGLRDLADWLEKHGVTHVAMESTGVFWKPVFNVLEERFEVLLCNARHCKNVPGRKTDQKDCDWLSQLLQLGLLRASFIPPLAMRQLRDLTRFRAELVSDKTRVANRIHKLLEDANIKLGCVATDILGVSGREILTLLMAGQSDPVELAKCAKARMKKKIPELKKALDGRFNEHHRDMLGTYWEHLTAIENMIEHVDMRIDAQMASAALSPSTPKSATPESVPMPEPVPMPETTPGDGARKPEKGEISEATGIDPTAQVSSAAVAKTAEKPPPPMTFVAAQALLVDMWGIDKVGAQNILAEIGTNMGQFPSHDHLASWTGICPGNNESAGKRRSGRTNKGNRWLRRALSQAAWAAARSKQSYFSMQFKRLAARRGKKRAIVAIAHAMLVTIYHMLKEHTPYLDLGINHFETLNGEKRKKSYIRRLEAMGYKVTLTQPS
jgi:transposase